MKEICYYFVFKRFGYLCGVNYFIFISKFEVDILAFVVEYSNVVYVVNIVNLWNK